MKRSEAIYLRSIVEQAAQSLPDNVALTVPMLYPTWKDCVDKGTVKYDKPGFRFSYGDKLFSCVNPNPTFQSDWVPGTTTASMYTEVCETHAGTPDDPIPYSGNMVLESGKYYSQDDLVYLCTRDTGIAVYNALSELVGLYVEEAK